MQFADAVAAFSVYLLTARGRSRATVDSYARDLTQFAELADRLGDDKTVDVVRKTLAKMSDRGRAEALALPLGAQERELVERALA